jgi:Fur family peroxide stress response transcriptional regulator
MGEARLEGLISKLRQRGYRVTPQRAAVLRVLATSEEHPSVEQIYEMVRADFPMTSLATVYKTLALLRDLGEVFELSIVGGGTRYDGCRPDFHPHLICVRCKRIVDLDAAPGGQGCEDVQERTGYHVLSHRHDFYGVCPECLVAQRRLDPATDDPAIPAAGEVV